jgi:predicted transcriptional regulator
MPKRLIEVLKAGPLLDIASYARKGPGRRDYLSPTEIELITRTVNRTPEVMVKVLTRGGQDLRAVTRHLEYLDRKGKLDLETDDGQRLGGKGVERELLEDWDLDIEEDRRRATLESRPARSPPKLVHKVLFSMPPGTQPNKVLEAVKNFAREEFGLKHRYAMVLHTDEPHPHVHVVIKAVSEQGARLNIRKATLREWRRGFARHLRDQGIAANATERAVRGSSRSNKRDGIYRTAERGASVHMNTRMDAVANRLATGEPSAELGKRKILLTRNEVERGWSAVANTLRKHGDAELAATVERFVIQMPRAQTENERLAAAVLSRSSERVYAKVPPMR